MSYTARRRLRTKNAMMMLTRTTPPALDPAMMAILEDFGLVGIMAMVLLSAIAPVGTGTKSCVDVELEMTKMGGLVAGVGVGVEVASVDANALMPTFASV